MVFRKWMWIQEKVENWIQMQIFLWIKNKTYQKWLKYLNLVQRKKKLRFEKRDISMFLLIREQKIFM